MRLIVNEVVNLISYFEIIERKHKCSGRGYERAVLIRHSISDASRRFRCYILPASVQADFPLPTRGESFVGSGDAIRLQSNSN